MWQVEVSHKSEMAGPFNRGDTIINKHFTFYFYIIGALSLILGSGSHDNLPSTPLYNMIYLQSLQLLRLNIKV